VLVHHQHNSEWHLGKSEVCGIKGDPLNAFGVSLAKSGFVVLAPDTIGFEDRRRNQKGNQRNEKTDWLQYYNGMAYRLLHDQYLMTTILNDALIGMSLLTQHTLVNDIKIGIMGHSSGGNISIFHGAVDERLKFVCASGAAGSYRNKIAHETGIEMSLVIPGILNKIDIPGIISCITAENILLVSGTEDIYSKDAADIVNRIRIAGKNIEHKQYEGGHALTPERYEFIVDWVKRLAL
jgi:dienelactone hydrolase